MNFHYIAYRCFKTVIWLIKTIRLHWFIYQRHVYLFFSLILQLEILNIQKCCPTSTIYDCWATNSSNKTKLSGAPWGSQQANQAFLIKEPHFPWARHHRVSCQPCCHLWCRPWVSVPRRLQICASSWRSREVWIGWLGFCGRWCRIRILQVKWAFREIQYIFTYFCFFKLKFWWFNQKKC